MNERFFVCVRLVGEKTQINYLCSYDEAVRLFRQHAGSPVVEDVWYGVVMGGYHRGASGESEDTRLEWKRNNPMEYHRLVDDGTPV